MAKYLDLEGLQYFGEKVKGELDNKVTKESGKGLSSNDFTTAEKNKLTELEGYTHPTSGVTEGTYKSVTVDAQGHVTGGTNPTTLTEYGITDAAEKTHTHSSTDIIAIDASKITGVLNISQIPAAALERLITVANKAARLALTVAQVQDGDTVQEDDTKKMYRVVDDSKLTSEAGYKEFTAGSAASVPWSGITDKPSTFAPEAHTHATADITNMPTAMKNPTALTIQVNGTSQGVYDGSAAKTVNITEATLGISKVSNSEIDAIFA
jgi:Phage-related tail fibre protein